MMRDERRSSNWTRRRRPQAVVLLVLIVIVSGCSSSDAQSTGEHADRPQPQLPGDSGIVPREDAPADFAPLSAENLPVAFGEQTYTDGSPTHYADGSPVFMPDGSPIDYRPRNIMQQLQRVPVAYIREATGELVMLNNAKMSPTHDPATGDVCWRAFECVNPNCSHRPADGGPSLYGERPSGVSLSDDGTIVRHASSELAGFRSDICPFCGADGGEEYQPKALAQRRTSLMRELERLNAASAPE